MTYINRVKKFLKKSSNKQKLIVIYGPTGAGKTAMSIEIAKYLDTEIISTDSRQIFKYMDIGTGKIAPDEMQWVTHHMIDILNPNEKFSMWDFVRQSEKIMNTLWDEDKIPMLVWGTGLYIDSLIFERNASDVSSDPVLRAELDMLSDEELYQKFQELDPEYAKEIHPNNRPYVERGIEVMYDRINRRVANMFDAWAEQEIRKLLAKWYNFDDFGMNSIGYREFRWYFEWEISREEVIAKIQQNSRNYAKRQLNWFRKYQAFI